MKNKLTFSALILVLSITWPACKKEFDIPPIKKINEGAKISIGQIKARYNPNNIYKFKGDTNLFVVVIADEVSGNLYKEIYVRDGSGGLHVKLVTSGGLFIGDSIRINLNDIILNSSAGLIQLDSVDTDKSIVKLASGLNPEPEAISLEQLINAGTSAKGKQSSLIKLSDVEFIPEHRGQAYGNSITKAATQYTLQDCNKNQVILRTSGFCYFADQKTPNGNGSIIAIVSQFNTTLQLLLRSANELSMSNAPCSFTSPNTPTTTPYLVKDFEDGELSSGGWIQINAVGTVSWTVKSTAGTSNNSKVAECNNYIGPGNQPACETWLISPPIDLSQANAPNFIFTSASFFSGPQLQTFVSTNYTSGAPNTATWTAVYPTYGISSNHIASGKIDLSNYKKATARLAFKYTGNNGAGQRWQVDNIWVGE
jgi:hypothetical protein